MITANPSLGQVITTAEVEDVPVNRRTPAMLGNLAMGVVSTFEPGPVRPFDNSAPNDISIGGAPATHNEMLLSAPNAGQITRWPTAPCRTPSPKCASAFLHGRGQRPRHGRQLASTSSPRAAPTACTGRPISTTRPRPWMPTASSTMPKLCPALPLPPEPIREASPPAAGADPQSRFNGRTASSGSLVGKACATPDPLTSPLETGSPENFTSVPTAAERTGDFSALLKLSSNPATIYDPSSGVLSGTLVSRTPFPGNIIPSNQISPVARPT